MVMTKRDRNLELEGEMFELDDGKICRNPGPPIYFDGFLIMVSGFQIFPRSNPLIGTMWVRTVVSNWDHHGQTRWGFNPSVIGQVDLVDSTGVLRSDP